MKVNYLTLLAGATILLLSAATTRAEESAASALATDANTAPAAKAQTASTAQVAAYRSDTVAYCDDCDPVRDFIVRAGAWGVHATGSPNKVGEYQSLMSSPFWDADGIWSNGERTVDVTVTGTDNETSDARVHYFGSHMQADVDYLRFEHQLDAHNYAGWNYNGNNTVGPSNTTTSAQDRTSIVVFSRDNPNPGRDYAIRVQEFKANFKGNLTENLKWRVNVFGIDKEGDRQVNSFTHCSSATSNGSQMVNPTTGVHSAVTNNQLTSQCHSVSQAQHIDWQTTEVTPSLEWRIGCDTAVEYSHTIRQFTQNDQAVTYNYAGNDALYTGDPTNRAGLAIVPNNQTQIDRLKFSTKIGCDTDVYMLGYAGYNKDELRDTDRTFNGADLRITNSSLEKLTLTARGKYYREDSSLPTTQLQGNYYAEDNANFRDMSGSDQINREVHTFGLDARWRPFQDECGTIRSRMAIVGGYEYSTLMRENAGAELTAANNGPFVVNGGTANGSVFTQPNSNKNTFLVGVEEKWSACWTTYIRYKYIQTEYPLYGITPEAGTSVNFALNSNLPTQENRIEMGGTWTPTDTLMVNATFYIENALNDAPYVRWSSNSLPFVVSTWWAPTECWSLSAGAAVMDGYINQDVSLGQLRPIPSTNVSGLTAPWQYNSSADVFNLGSRYMITEKASLSGEFEYVHGLNSVYAPVDPATSTPIVPGAPGNGPAAPYTLGQYSLVKMQSFRLGAGLDYRLRPRVTTFARYNYYDYQDISSGLTSGQAHMLLGGMSALF